ncbi:MAG: response regulator [Ignavibacteriae bacterium]|nr:MAG: response regulator [Ignavibacteriota bacterium]
MLYAFKKEGYETEWAENGLQGYIKTKSFQPDLIVSDIMMPEVDGHQFRKQLLEDEKLKLIPFVFLTAKGDEDDILGGYDLQVNDYIVKTSGPKLVCAKISAIIQATEKERSKAVEEVHKAANSMGTKTVPDKAPKLDGFAVEHWHVPFQNVPGGDFIDYFKIDENKMIVVLGDIMGKKWGAWYFAVAYAGYVRSAIRMVLDSEHEISPAAILERVNRAIYKDERISDIFITLSVVLINNENNTVTYAGAGDLPIIHKSDEVKCIKSNGILIGFSETSKYENIEVKIKKGDFVYIITDGIPETRCTDGEFFGQERLTGIIDSLAHSDEILEKIKTNFIELTDNKFEDDISIIGIRAN